MIYIVIPDLIVLRTSQIHYGHHSCLQNVTSPWWSWRSDSHLCFLQLSILSHTHESPVSPDYAICHNCGDTRKVGAASHVNTALSAS